MKNKESFFESLINKKRLLENFIEILKIKSPSRNEKEIICYIKDALDRLGFSTTVDDSGKYFGSNSGNLIAYLPKNNNEKTLPVFIGAHADTVALNGEIIPEIKNGRVINKNSKCILGADDKVAIAAMLEAAYVLMENKLENTDIYFIFTISEEAGILGAKYLDLKKIKASYGFVFDGEGDIGAIFNEAPYHNSFRISVKGKASHAGIEPEKGINSIKIAADAISILKPGRYDYETTYNIGVINGGIATNIIPEITNIEAEARSLDLKKLDEISNFITDTFKNASKKHKAKVNIKVEREYNGFKIEEDEVCVLIAKKALNNMGIVPKIVSTGGGSDINIFNARGKKSVNLSSGMENAHSSSEYVKIEQLEKLAALVLEICTIKLDDNIKASMKKGKSNKNLMA